MIFIYTSMRRCVNILHSMILKLLTYIVMIILASWNFIINSRQLLKTSLRLMSASCKEQTKKLKPVVLGVPAKMRDNPVVKIIDTPEFRSIFTEEVNSLSGLFKKYNYEVRIAGGAVRDILMGIKPKDLDFATTATPNEMKTMFTEENIRMINTKGEKHGTITPRINDKENFEVTTLRIDVCTDGRHAEVQFTTDWQLDANRRDLTINSMFLDLDGTLYDYFYGYDDLQKRKVIFVGDASVRIQEDYLRILRYFRFYGRIARDADSHDKATLEAIRKNAEGLASISGERIWSEMKKIVVGNFAEKLVLQMIDCGLTPFCGLPNEVNLKEFKRFCLALEKLGKPNNPILVMTPLLNNKDDAIKLHQRLKLSAYERDLAYFIVKEREKVDIDYKTLKDYQMLCLRPYAQREYIEELLKYCGKEELYTSFKSWSIPTFPINGTLLKEKGYAPSKKMGSILNELKLIWAESDFTLSADELLDKNLPAIERSLPPNSPSHKKIKLSS